MADLDIIDIHTHTFQTAERGISWQMSAGGWRRAAPGAAAPPRNGTIEELSDLMREGGISRSVMFMYTPTRFMYEARIKQDELPSDPVERRKIEREVETIMAQRAIGNNEWAIGVSAQHPEFINVAGLDPVYMDEAMLVGEMEDKVRRGSKGFKLVMPTLKLYADDPRMWPVYEHASRLGVPIVMLAGSGTESYGSAERLTKPMAAFPDVVLIVTGTTAEHITELCHRFPNVHSDLAGRFGEVTAAEPTMTLESLAAFIRECGVDRLSFGSNYPAFDPVLYAGVMREVPLNDRERELVANGNAKSLFSL